MDGTMLKVIFSNVYSAAAVVALFGISIFVHECGHFLVARWCGLTADVFSLGFGPALWKRRWRGVTYRIGCIPFGGYVTLPQLDPAGMERVQEGAESAADAPPRVLPPAAPWKKILVALAGAGGNLVLAFVLAWAVYLADKPLLVGQEGTVAGHVEPGTPAFEAGLRPGDAILTVNGRTVRTWQAVLQAVAMRDLAELRVRRPDGSEATFRIPTTAEENLFGLHALAGVEEGSVCKVGIVEKDSPADRAGLRSGDVIKFVDGTPVASWGHMLMGLQTRAGQETEIRLERQGKPLTVQVTPILDETLNLVRIGIRFDTMVMTPLEQIRQDATGILRFLKSLGTPGESGKAAKGVGGAVSILVAFWLHVQAGLVLALGFTRFLNVNLAILNLFPLPILDGGHILFALGEWITGRKPGERFTRLLFNTFFVILLSLMLFLAFRDVLGWNRIRQRWASAAAAEAERADPAAPGAPAEEAPAEDEPAEEAP